MSPTIYPDRPTPQPSEPAQPPPLPPQPVQPEVEEDWESPFPERARRGQPVAYRGATNDPVFGYIIALALAIGLTPLIPANTDLRYVLLWMVLAGFGVLSWLMGSSARISTETPENLFWGVIFGLIIAVPLLLVGGTTLQITAHRLFPAMTIGETLALLVFVMPLAETLFFRGVLQERQAFWVVGLLTSLWSGLLFFPVLDVQHYPAVALVIGTALLLMNGMYSYVRQRNGLAAAWLCQIVVNLVLLFLPFL